MLPGEMKSKKSFFYTKYMILVTNFLTLHCSKRFGEVLVKSLLHSGNFLQGLKPPKKYTDTSYMIIRTHLHRHMGFCGPFCKSEPVLRNDP